MKNKRHEKIIELIEKYDIETQEELAGLLNDAGFLVTQATVSRDIKKLELIKVKTKGGHQKYKKEVGTFDERDDKYTRVLKDAVTGMEDASNIVVIKTVPGMAMAVAAALDSLKIPEIIGSIAGDDTIMCATKDVKQAKDVIEKLHLIV
ncbi:MAG: arginine repressor [Lachnospiraceae bacterium]|nr:arginine repressor [Lachnospiraceae bacterium]